MVSRRFTFANSQPAATIPDGFVVCPMVTFGGGEHQERVREIYQLAYQQACELHRPSRWAPLYAPSLN